MLVCWLLKALSLVLSATSNRLKERWALTDLDKVMQIPYSGKLSREKIFANARDRAFHGEFFPEFVLLPYLCQQKQDIRG